jgi:hypothetical protein
MSNLNTLIRQEYKGKIYVKNIITQIYVGPQPTGKSDPDPKKIIPDQQQWPLVFFYTCLSPDPLNPLNPDQAYPSKRNAVCNFFQKIMSIT